MTLNMLYFLPKGYGYYTFLVKLVVLFIKKEKHENQGDIYMIKNPKGKYTYRAMAIGMKLIDKLSNQVKKRMEDFDISEGMTVVDYGCGPGRYSRLFSEKVGDLGKVYAVDVHKEAIKDIELLIRNTAATNLMPQLATDYNSGLADHIADRVFAIDMFHGIEKTKEFLAELKRISKPNGLIYIDYGHQSKKYALNKIKNAKILKIIEEFDEYVVCSH